MHKNKCERIRNNKTFFSHKISLKSSWGEGRKDLKWENETLTPSEGKWKETYWDIPITHYTRL